MIEWLNDNAGAVMALLTLVYVAATIALVVLANRQIASALTMERSRLRANLTWTVTIEQFSLFIKLANTGQTPATNIKISLDQNLKSVFGGKGEFPATKREVPIHFIEKGIQSLPASGSVDALVGFWERVEEAYPELIWTGSMSFTDVWGKQHTNPIILDATPYRDRITITKNGMHEIHTVLEKIERTLNHISTGYSKPLIRTIKEEDYTAQRLEEFTKARAALEAHNSGNNECNKVT
ncbi:hypothetical protein [Rariglobus hedericola]|uniref:Uncharacterized protein n=1 Tax=Rariglobus hedericola TaxID=2597822 RepID=A0A556QDI4_9BACT|nr:hypothetical protein [Rariglobus hedericola]TSJ74722.1 hypothetical protein FPL22_17415 [Rariglobus hedericola]